MERHQGVGVDVFRSCRSIYACLGGGLLIAIAAIIGIAGVAAWRESAQTLKTQRTVVAYEVDDAYEYLEGQIRQMVYWQDAFDHLVRTWDRPWATYQFGPYQDTLGNHQIAMFDGRRALRFLHVGVKGTGMTEGSIAQARGLDALLRKTLAASVHQPPPMVSGGVVVGGAPYFATAALVTPEGDADLAYARAHPIVVVFFKPMTAEQFAALTDGFGASGMHIDVKSSGVTLAANAAVTDADGKPIAWLDWQPHSLGQDFLIFIILPIVAVLLLLATMQSIVVRRWQAMQTKLFAAEAKAAAAQEQSRVKSVFLGAISHELRTPLNAIIGFSEVLTHKLFGPVGAPQYEDYARHIHESGRALLRIVNDLIEIARIEAHDTGGERETINAAQCAKTILDEALPMARAKSVQLAFNGDQDVWCIGSALSFRQVLSRLVEYGIRYTPDGGRVSVRVAYDGPHIMLQVIDAGCGTLPENLARINGTLLDATEHMTAGAYDTELGIEIIKGLVRLMGGTLHYDSEFGEGTTVTIRLPRAEPPSKAEKKVAA